VKILIHRDIFFAPANSSRALTRHFAVANAAAEVTSQLFVLAYRELCLVLISTANTTSDQHIRRSLRAPG